MRSRRCLVLSCLGRAFSFQALLFKQRPMRVHLSPRRGNRACEKQCARAMGCHLSGAGGAWCCTA